MPGPLRALSLDLDGTLADTLGICVETFQDVIERLQGARPSAAEVVAGFGASEEGILTRLAGRQDPDLEDRWHTRYAELLRAAAVAPFVGVRAAMERARAAGLRLAVVTGKGRRSAEHTLDHLGLRDLVDFLGPGDVSGSIKDQRLRAFAMETGIVPEHIAHLGDSHMDIIDARAAGCVTLGAAWAPTTDRDRLAAEDPDHLFDTVVEFTAWLEERLAR